MRNFSCVQTFTAEDRWKGGISAFVPIAPHKQILGVGRAMHIFEYQKLENPELTDDTAVFCALYNATTLTVMTASAREVKIWDAKDGALLRVYRELSQSELTVACLDFRERKVIIGDHDGQMAVLDYLNGAEMKNFQYTESDDRAHRNEVTRLCYCDKYKTVISCSWDRSIMVHDDNDSERGILLRQMIGGHSSDITALAYSENLSLIASASSDATLQIWDYEFGRLEGARATATDAGITALR